MAKNQQGFTVVELLITLFVAVAFLVAGWQVYSLVIRESGEARSKSRAINIAYDYIQRYSTEATTPCTTKNPLTDSPVTISGLGEALLSVTISCPQPNTSAISKVQVTVKYGSPQQTTVQSTLVNKIDQRTLESGLAGWWPMNGNVNDVSGNSVNGTLLGGALTTGQGGNQNTAYRFTGAADQYISIGSNTLFNSLVSTGFTMSIWIKYEAASPTSQWPRVFIAGPTHNVYGMLSSAYGANTYFEYSKPPYDGTSYAGVGPSNISGGNWTLQTVVYSPAGQIDVYRNGALLATHYSVLTSAAPSFIIGQYYYGSVDDARIYTRALTATDVRSLYDMGAF